MLDDWQSGFSLKRVLFLVRVSAESVLRVRNYFRRIWSPWIIFPWNHLSSMSELSVELFEQNRFMLNYKTYHLLDSTIIMRTHRTTSRCDGNSALAAWLPRGKWHPSNLQCDYEVSSSPPPLAPRSFLGKPALSSRSVTADSVQSTRNTRATQVW